MGKRCSILPTRRSQIVRLHFDGGVIGRLQKSSNISYLLVNMLCIIMNILEVKKIKIGLVDPKNLPQIRQNHISNTVKPLI